MQLSPGGPGIGVEVEALDDIGVTAVARSGAGLVVGVRRGAARLVRAYGMADVAAGRPVDEQSVFEVGSLSKMATGLCVQLLVDDGQLGLDDPVDRWFPELAGITVHYLLHHTAGIRDYHAINALSDRVEQRLTHAQALAVVRRQSALNHAPGEMFSYSDSHYLVLAHVVEQVSGVPLADWSTRHLFAPLHLRDTSWRTDATAQLPGLVTGYGPAGDRAYDEVVQLYESYGCSRLLTTADDLLTLAAALDTDDLAGVGQPDLVRRFTATTCASATPTTYGHGINIDDLFGCRVWEHSGADPGCTADFLHFPDDALTVVALTNSTFGDTPSITRAVAALVFDIDAATPEPAAPGAHPPTASPSDVIGVYRLALPGAPHEGLPIVVDYHDEELHADMGVGTARLDASSGNTFRSTSTAASVTVDAEVDGARITLPQGGPAFDVRRVPMGAPSPADRASFAGDYHSADLDCTWQLRDDGDRLWLDRGAGDPVELFAGEVAGELLAPMIVVRFDAARPDTFLMHSFRLNDLRFVRVVRTTPLDGGSR